MLRDPVFGVSLGEFVGCAKGRVGEVEGEARGLGRRRRGDYLGELVGKCVSNLDGVDLRADGEGIGRLLESGE